MAEAEAEAGEGQYALVKACLALQRRSIPTRRDLPSSLCRSLMSRLLSEGMFCLVNSNEIREGSSPFCSRLCSWL